MGEENQEKQPLKMRRFRLARRMRLPEEQIKPPAVETREEREMRELAGMGDEADRGTPEQDAAVRKGCMSMVRVVMLFFVVMFTSIAATWCIKR